MKKAGVVLALLITAGGLMASPQVRERTDMAVKGYVQALASDVDGLKDNAIFRVACLKALHPGADLDVCAKALEKISKKEDDLCIRLHAHMALAYLRDSTLVDRVKVISTDDPGVFFEQLYREISTTAVAAK